MWCFRHTKRIPVRREVEYLDKLVRGVYAKKDLKKGEKLYSDDYFMAILNMVNYHAGVFEGELISKDMAKNEPIMVDNMDTLWEK